jgi:hypothetical protein
MWLALALALATPAALATAKTAKTTTAATKTTARTRSTALAASRGLLSRLETHGRAVASIEYTQPDPFGDGARQQKGTIAIEPPDRTRLDFASGESVALRSDGGEWLQPELGQMLRLSAEHAASARQWWSLLLPGAETRFTERTLGMNERLVIAKDADVADSAWVSLGPDGLPRALRFRGLDGEFVRVKFLTWSFAKPRGPSAFVLAAPAGVNIVEMP